MGVIAKSMGYHVRDTVTIDSSDSKVERAARFPGNFGVYTDVFWIHWGTWSGQSSGSPKKSEDRNIDRISRLFGRMAVRVRLS